MCPPELHERDAAAFPIYSSTLYVQVWLSFSVVTLYMFYLCMRSAKLDPSTPRLIFSFFLYSHNVCVAIGACGYVLFLLELLGLGPLIWKLLGKSASAILLWYGLYFGILGRDTAEVAFSGLVRNCCLVYRDAWVTIVLHVLVL